LAAGRVQAEVLQAVCQGVTDPNAVDLDRAEAMMRERLLPLLLVAGLAGQSRLPTSL